MSLGNISSASLLGNFVGGMFRHHHAVCCVKKFVRRTSCTVFEGMQGNLARMVKFKNRFTVWFTRFAELSAPGWEGIWSPSMSALV